MRLRRILPIAAQQCLYAMCWKEGQSLSRTTRSKESSHTAFIPHETSTVKAPSSQQGMRQSRWPNLLQRSKSAKSTMSRRKIKNLQRKQKQTKLLFPRQEFRQAEVVTQHVCRITSLIHTWAAFTSKRSERNSGIANSSWLVLGSGPDVNRLNLCDGRPYRTTCQDGIMRTFKALICLIFAIDASQKWSPALSTLSDLITKS